jgi:hypothetical protein
MEYGNRNQVDPNTLTLSRISGVVMFQRGKLPKSAADAEPIDGACIGLFTEKGHRLVVSAKADGAGRFRLRRVPAGLYRLVVRDPDGLLCVANVPLEVTSEARGDTSSGKSLVIHMRAPDLDDCSYGELK